jgi:hypothetical protein
VLPYSGNDKRFTGDGHVYDYLAEQMSRNVKLHLRGNWPVFVSRLVYKALKGAWRDHPRATAAKDDPVHRSVAALIKGHAPPPGGVPLEELPPPAQQLVGEMRALLGLADQPDVVVNERWLADDANLPALMRCLAFMAHTFQAQGVQGVTLVPLNDRRLVHIDLDSDAIHGILKQAQEQREGAVLWRPFGEGERAPPCPDTLEARKRLWGLLFNMPTLLQRGKLARLPWAERHNRHALWKLSFDVFEGRTVHGGWGFTGTRSTDGVALCVSLWRAEYLQRRELAAQQSLARESANENAGLFSRQEFVEQDAIVIGMDTGLRNSIAAVFCKVRTLCHCQW